MATLDGVGFSGLGELFQRVEARGLEHPVARAGIVRIGDDQRACDELREQVGHGEFIDRLVGRDRRGGFQREAANEDGQPSQHHALLLRKQPVTPVERPAQCLLARQCRAGSTGQQFEAIIQPGIDLLDRQGTHTRSRQFERQRYAVEVDAQLRHRGRVRSRQLELGLMALRSLDEQLHGLGGPYVVHTRRRIGQRQCRQRVGLLTRDVQGLATGGDDRQLRRAAQHRVGKPRTCVEQMLAIVEQQQELAPLDPAAQGLQQRFPCCFTHPQHLGHRTRHQ